MVNERGARPRPGRSMSGACRIAEHDSCAGRAFDDADRLVPCTCACHSSHPVVDEVWEHRATCRAVVVQAITEPEQSFGQVHVRPVGMGERFSVTTVAFVRDWERADDRYQSERPTWDPDD